MVLLCGCGMPKQKGLVYVNDLESIKGWTQLNLTKKIAHSGLYSNKFDSSHVYGLTFNQLFRELSDDKITKAKVSFWIYMDKNASGKLVLEVKKPNNTDALWTAKNLADIVPKRGEWQQVNLNFTLNDSINKPENAIAIYPWNLSKGNFYIDDMRIEFILGY